jgi:MinD superfamily P-loop ATPase
MIISVASGKGGTGKTTVAVNLALSLGKVQFLDCDVEEPDAHIFLKPDIQEKKEAYIPVPQVYEDRCNYCGRCGEVCEYNAIAVLQGSAKGKGSVLIFHHLCHGCGACSILCPQDAMLEVNRAIGMIESGYAGNIRFIHGKLTVGEIMSPPLIRQVMEYIRPSGSRKVTFPGGRGIGLGGKTTVLGEKYTGKNNSAGTVIIDAPPGTSCPVIESVKESDFCILVTEPTPFGLNDLTLAVEVMKKMKIPHGVVINRSGSGDWRIEKYCMAEKIPVLMKIPFSREIAALYSAGLPVVGNIHGFKDRFKNLYKTLLKAKYETINSN